MKNTIILVCLLLGGVATHAQTSDKKISLSLETGVLPWLSGGYSGALFVNLPEHWSFGLVTGGQPWRNFNQSFEDFLLSSSNPDALTMRWPVAVGLEARYLFSKRNEGLYGQIGLGWEDFQVRVGDAIQTNGNGYVGPGLGYQWFPKGQSGFYFLPKIGGIFLFNRPQRVLEGVSYRLNTFFPNAELAIGWKFGK